LREDFFFGAFAIGDVADKFGSADDATGMVATRRASQGDVNPLAVFTDALGFEVVAELPY
jgi:hypothetical protein